jgi:hypothetical protein
MHRKVSAGVDGGAERKVERVQTWEGGPPSALAEFFLYIFVVEGIQVIFHIILAGAFSL